MWYAIFEEETGRLVSLCTELVPLPPTLGYVEEEGEDMPVASRWDPEFRSFVAPAEPQARFAGIALAVEGEEGPGGHAELPDGSPARMRRH